jgi:dihydropteroate synthase
MCHMHRPKETIKKREIQQNLVLPSVPQLSKKIDHLANAKITADILIQPGFDPETFSELTDVRLT